MYNKKLPKKIMGNVLGKRTRKQPKFLVDIPTKDFNKVKKGFRDGDADIDTDEDHVKELFMFAYGSHGGYVDVRDKVKVKKLRK